MSFRVIDGGIVFWLDSQVFYHAVASAMNGASQPTVTLVVMQAAGDQAA